jgi:hypothetical protein
MNPVGPPPRLVALAEEGVFGSLRQPPMLSQPSRWETTSPRHLHVFHSLPPHLDRDSVRRFCDGQSRDANGVVATFIASQVWGYGDTGYGPHRVSRALSSSDLVPALQCAADELDAGFPVTAFEALCQVFELPQVGTAFGTKYLYFADRRRQALILDSIVAKWLEANTDERFDLDRNVESYERWLELASSWSESLDVTPEQIELAIFTDQLPSGSQWRLE